ncbi:MAG: permease [Desulfobacterales bacterium]|nr:permease [Desulfobacterales bacterium]
MKNELNTEPFPIVQKIDTQKELPSDKPGLLNEFGTYFQLFFLAAAGWLAVVYGQTEAFVSFAIIFSSIVLEALPFMLMGTLLGGCVEIFLSREQLIRILPKSPKRAIILAAFMGILFPVCECAIVPVVRKFIQKGMPLGAAVAFMLGGPIVNPLVFSSTLVAYSFAWDVAILRTFTGAGIAMAIGLLIHSTFSKNQGLLQVDNNLQDQCNHCGTAGCGHDHQDLTGQPFLKKLMAAISHGAMDFYDIGRFLIIGAFIAAALQTIVPRQAFFSVATGAFTAIGVMMVLAIVLNLCSEADAFIAASLAPIGIPFTAQMAFMVLGPMLDIKLILMYMSVFSRKMIIILSTTIFIFVFMAMAFMEVVQWL